MKCSTLASFRANEEDQKLRDVLEDRDYTEINRIQDEKAYLEIRNRDDSWSEAKALLMAKNGGKLESTNPNMVPLGKRKLFVNK